MHPNPAFRGPEQDENAGFARDRGFGVLAVTLPDGPPLISHVPFLLSDDATYAELHLVRSNPIARLGEVADARIAVTGPDSYVSPDWYDLPEQVPTWNYIAVHLTGRLSPLPESALPALLDRVTARFEARLAPKPEWTMDKMPDQTAARMMRAILPFRLEITAIDGTWKLNQNKPDPARLSAAHHIGAHGVGAETRLLSALMLRPPAPKQ